MNDVKDEKQHKNERRRRNNRRRKDAPRKSGGQYTERPSERIKLYEGEPVECSFCGKPVTDVASALADRTTDKPVHFDCVLDYLAEHETLSDGQSISYIGQGRFAVISSKVPASVQGTSAVGVAAAGAAAAGLPSPRFVIERIIEWEPRDKKYEWRANIADAYSKIK
jgi:hypothetical protein